jgi:hypothetical protein
MICRGKIINDLDFISLCQSRDRFQLADQSRVHDEIGDEIANDDVFVADGNSLIELNLQSGATKFESERITIDRFKKTRTAR